jgi:DNA invertase Pin-like site-specific DNA recombinase/peptidoglycan hydrolase-like protein with peptidoglycan-binding domain
LSRLLLRTACAAVTLSVVGMAAALAAPLPAATAAATSGATDAAVVLHQGVGLGARPSDRVRRMQRILDRRGFDLGPPGVDGRFGPLTAAAVVRMQDRYGLVADGIVGPKTRRLLNLLAAGERTPRRAHRPQAPAQNRPPAPTPQRPATPPPARTQPQAAPPAHAAQAPADRSEPPAWLPMVAIVAAVLAAAALAIAITLARRPHPDGAPALVALDRGLFLEGHSDQPAIGAFRGVALAMGVPHHASEDPAQTRYLIEDPLKPAPIWVRGGEIRRSPSRLADGDPVIGYVTGSRDATREQQAFMEIEALCEESGWTLEELIREREEVPMPDRPGLRRALEHIAAGEARGLIVTDLQSVTDAMSDLGALLEWFREADAALIALDLALDTSTAGGHQTASTLIAVAGWENERGTARARSGLAQVATRDRPSAETPTPEDRARLIERITAMRQAGMTLQAIADQLNNEGVPTTRGGTWRASSVSSALRSTRTTRSIRAELPRIPREKRR